MRDLSPTGSAQTAGTLTPEIFGDTASGGLLLDTRARLAHALQTTLQSDDLVSIFFRHSRNLVSYDGLVYQDPQQRHIKLGQQTTHHCLYNLSLPDSDLGRITFYRRQRFSDTEQQCLESLLASLAFPLRNAQHYQKAVRMALIDPLTQVGNRAALDRTLDHEHQLLQRGGQGFALLMIDIDHFKQINDLHGHGAGDKIIAEVAATIERISRGSDTTFRYGGEEFSLVLSATGASGGLITAERLRRAIEQMKFIHNGKIIHTTVSIGVSACQDADESLDQLLERADSALYKAKRAGRNRACCEAPEITEKSLKKPR
ncbi:GGDEF domain-containing protein [Gilvimarinus xylanilyticus]|uniref:diguanylate cyclase n=1 Tax=Gilvimarinus xylanilyticus TaxID=2944139 RepID=A0A9X2HYI8_9GAMM|nr:GGDEF domain-containing protein [Gilvimarinus xylanilyticus]MCP8898831.1 GGDEF domain-containing protein [Gilvimarinus xylanilyticus]